MADLKRKSVRGGMVTMASQGVSIVVQLASTVISHLHSQRCLTLPLNSPSISRVF